MLFVAIQLVGFTGPLVNSIIVAIIRTSLYLWKFQHAQNTLIKGAPDPVARELYFQTEYCMNIIQIPHSRTL